MDALLAAAGLPVDGVGDNLQHFFVVDDPGGNLIGAAGLELFADVALLRSTVVTESARGLGHGAALVERVLFHARESGCREIYLLTLDADGYFQRFGFSPVSRDKAPGAIRSCREFTTLCPATAVLMRRTFAA